MRPLKYIPQYTVADYNQWEGDWELIDGVPSAMSPSPIRKHQLLAAAIVNRLYSAIEISEEAGKDCMAVYALDWIVNESTVVRPDIALICDIEGDFITTPPVLIVEVISPSSAYKDRIVKSEIYSGQGVKYYILADPDTKTFQIFLLNETEYVESNSNTNFIIHPNFTIQLNLNEAMQKFAS